LWRSNRHRSVTGNRSREPVRSGEEIMTRRLRLAHEDGHIIIIFTTPIKGIIEHDGDQVRCLRAGTGKSRITGRQAQHSRGCSHNRTTCIYQRTIALHKCVKAGESDLLTEFIEPSKARCIGLPSRSNGISHWRFTPLLGKVHNQGPGTYLPR